METLPLWHTTICWNVGFLNFTVSKPVKSLPLNSLPNLYYTNILPFWKKAWIETSRVSRYLVRHLFCVISVTGVHFAVNNIAAAINGKLRAITIHTISLNGFWYISICKIIGKWVGDRSEFIMSLNLNYESLQGQIYMSTYMSIY